MSNKLRVEIGSDAYASCFCHALSTEHEEIMGLLIGTYSRPSIDEVVCQVFLSMVLIRSDKRKDRVEIPVETMAGVTSKVEEIAKDVGIDDLRVVGWYHSHPHITPLPSHVDLRTQSNYQLLDKNFIGLIFSVFDRDAKTLSSSEQLCCFQSVDGQQRLVPFQVVPSLMLFQRGFSHQDEEEEARTVQKHAEVKRLATGAIATIFELYLKEEQEAYDLVDAPFEDSDADYSAANFVRRIANGATFAAAIAKIVSVCHDNQVEAAEARVKISEARVAALTRYRDALKAKVAEKEAAAA